MLQLSVLHHSSTCLMCCNANRLPCKGSLLELIFTSWRPVYCKFILRLHSYIDHLLVTVQVQKRKSEAWSEARHAAVTQNCHANVAA